MMWVPARNVPLQTQCKVCCIPSLIGGKDERRCCSWSWHHRPVCCFLLSLVLNKCSDSGEYTNRELGDQRPLVSGCELSFSLSFFHLEGYKCKGRSTHKWKWSHFCMIDKLLGTIGRYCSVTFGMELKYWFQTDDAVINKIIIKSVLGFWFVPV